jgi:hypothetical protein
LAVCTHLINQLAVPLGHSDISAHLDKSCTNSMSQFSVPVVLWHSIAKWYSSCSFRMLADVQ